MSALGYKNHLVLGRAFQIGWHPKLIDVLIWLTVRISKDKLILTSSYRPGGRGVHSTNPLRAFDLRSWVFDDAQRVADDINKWWTYDPKRPEYKVCLYHSTTADEQGYITGYEDDWHFHIQVHPRTYLAVGGL